MKKAVVLIISLLVALGLSAQQPSEKITAKPIDLTKETFKELVFDYENNPTEWKYIGDKPAIIDFHAKWCGPCRVTSPILTDLATEYSGEIYIYKVDVDEEPELAQMFGARSIPMFLFIPIGEEPQMGVGALPKKSFKEVIDKFLLKKEEL
ncbi:MAG: thioredoxin family protein [Fermentimonas sp.]|jgi:thioredoxin 1